MDAVRLAISHVLVVGSNHRKISEIGQSFLRMTRNLCWLPIVGFEMVEGEVALTSSFICMSPRFQALAAGIQTSTEVFWKGWYQIRVVWRCQPPQRLLYFSDLHRQFH
jgi:hypothetical protein